jgi:extracellular factor (EF) 3-hydroxypalmitic acid methyl ester biosynthesis protein
MTNHQALFTQAHEQILNNNFISGFQLLGKPLSELYRQHEALGTADQLIEDAHAHPIFPSLQQDPYTSRAFTKPRGYAGDAVMLDYVYQTMPTTHVSPMGAGIFQATTRVSMGLSVVYRKALLNAYINDTVSHHYPFRILSVASGHCRELADSLALEPAFEGQFFALDADALSCAEVSKTYATDKVQVIHASVKDLLSGKLELGDNFDFIYSAGLFDYLPTPSASALVQLLSSKLRHDGRLLIANFVPQSFGRGYMECFMDWKLIYRTEEELVALFPLNLQDEATSFF